MVGLISSLVRRTETVTASANPALVDHLQRLEQAAGFSMVAFDTDDDLSAQAQHDELWQGEAGAKEGGGVTHRVVSLIDECTAAVTSYLRPAI